MAYTINIKDEVEAILGRALTVSEFRVYRYCRQCGYANPHDIIAQM